MPYILYGYCKLVYKWRKTKYIFLIEKGSVIVPSVRGGGGGVLWFYMYIDIGERIAGKQDGPSLIIQGPPNDQKFTFLSYAVGPGTGDIATPPVRPSHLVLHCNSKTHWCIFSKLCRYVHHVMGVCCILFDIDGMLFQLFLNFLNIEKNKMYCNLVGMDSDVKVHNWANILNLLSFVVVYHLTRLIIYNIFFNDMFVYLQNLPMHVIFECCVVFLIIATLCQQWLLT